MTKFFWDHLYHLDEVKLTLDKHGLKEEEKIQLLEVVGQTIHLRVVDIILTHLPKEKHQQFLDAFSSEPHHPGLLENLKKDITDLETKIITVAHQVKQEILKELTS